MGAIPLGFIDSISFINSSGGVVVPFCFSLYAKPAVLYASKPPLPSHLLATSGVYDSLQPLVSTGVVFPPGDGGPGGVIPPGFLSESGGAGVVVPSVFVFTGGVGVVVSLFDPGVKKDKPASALASYSTLVGLVTFLEPPFLQYQYLSI
jgi:hypothetical protein